jgi:hypothetical protein
MFKIRKQRMRVGLKVCWKFEFKGTNGEKKKWVYYIHTWKCHNETPCVPTFISNKLKCHVFHFIFSLFSSAKLQSKRNKSYAWGGWHQWEGGGVGEKG